MLIAARWLRLSFLFLLLCSFRGYTVVITTYHIVGAEANTVLEDQAEEEEKVRLFPVEGW